MISFFHCYSQQNIAVVVKLMDRLEYKKNPVVNIRKVVSDWQ